ncbi:MAG: hypothetical protein COT85_01275 [Chlamydiae bacterium CG10_big_fil_rev_8_21_14_0_10_42_34]|nr:MAG: hypothetical protein COT85_01275 [Chlamydiae bacterium CG10_big_fil_rev_8_21_14_0_10_42_34]
MSASSIGTLPSPPPLKASKDAPVQSSLEKIALATLKELSATFAMGLTVACFIPLPSGVAMIASAAAIQIALNTLFHSLGTYAAQKATQEGVNKHFYENTVSFCEWTTGSSFALFTGFNVQTLIHETGHSLAALALYKNSVPQIEIYPFAGGTTQFYKSSLSALGKKIGPAATTCAVIASGPAFTLMISAVILSVGLLIRETHTHLSKYLISWGALDFLYHAKYAYSAIHTDAWNLTHDFVHLSIFGLHPIVAATTILAIPILITLGMNWKQTKAFPIQA